MLSWLIKSLHVIILELAGGIGKNSLQLPSCKLQPGLWGWDQSSYPPWAFLWLVLWGLVEGFSASVDLFCTIKIPFSVSGLISHKPLWLNQAMVEKGESSSRMNSSWSQVQVFTAEFYFSLHGCLSSTHSPHMSYRIILWLHFFSSSLPRAYSAHSQKHLSNGTVHPTWHKWYGLFGNSGLIVYFPLFHIIFLKLFHWYM